MKKRFYFDYAASMSMTKGVLKAMNGAVVFFGNPSSPHHEGIVANRALTEARRKIGTLLGAKQSEIIFTGGATEANNIIILGVLKNHKKAHVITSLAEHPSVLEPCRELEKMGHEVSYLESDANGHISAEKILAVCRKNTIIISLSLVNGETGAIQPLRKLINTIKGKTKNILFHSDVSQCAGLLDISPHNLGLDYMTINVSKIGGPKKFSILFKKEAGNLSSIFFGGGQEMGISPGTENIPAVIGAFHAIKEAEKNRKSHFKYMLETRNFFVECLKNKMPEIEVLGKETKTLPSFVVIKMEGIPAESLALALDDNGLAVSNGSACVANSRYLRKTETIRFSFDKTTTKKDIIKATDIFYLTFLRLQKIYNNK